MNECQNCTILTMKLDKCRQLQAETSKALREFEEENSQLRSVVEELTIELGRISYEFGRKDVR